MPIIESGDIPVRTAIAQPNHELQEASLFRPPHLSLDDWQGEEVESFLKKSTIFAQGDSTDGLFFIQGGKVQLSVVSEAGKEATLAILSEGDFFGEGGLAGQPIRMSSAIAATDCILLHVSKNAMMLAMGREPKLSAMFVKYLLKRNIRISRRSGRSAF